MRLALIAFGAMLPNILDNIAGAEKTGWSTHYHSVYFPFLVAAALIGFANLWKRVKTKTAQWGLLAAPLAMGAMLLFWDPYSGVLSFPPPICGGTPCGASWMLWRKLR
jgi:hypothetical protein